MVLRSLVPICLGFLIASPSIAGVIITSTDRSITANANSVSAPVNSTVPFSGTVVSGVVPDYGSSRAFITSTIGTTSFVASGTAETNTSDTSGPGAASSQYEVSFSLDQAYSYSYTVKLDTGLDFIPSDSAIAAFGLDSGSTSLISHQSDFLDFLPPVDTAGLGLLGPGNYTLFVRGDTVGQGQGFGNMTAEYDMTFSLTAINTVVPEPTSMSMFAILIGATALRRRRNS